MRPLLPAILCLALVVSAMNTHAASLTTADMNATLDADGLTFNWPGQGASLVAPGPTLTTDGVAIALPAEGWSAQVRRATVDDALGAGEALVVAWERPGLARVTRVVRVGLDGSQIVITTSVSCLAEQAITVTDLQPLGAGRLTLGEIRDGDATPTVYVDSGSQGGTHIARLDESRSCAGICAVYNPVTDRSFVAANLAFEHDDSVAVAPAEGAIGLTARTSTAIAIAPGETHEFDPLLLDCRTNPFEALERYGDAVRTHVNPPIPEELPCGWISWYGYRLTMTEDTIIENAEVIAEHLRKYGVRVIQPDHGWQDRDICGNWVTNEKFPHGMPWLKERMEILGFELGLWAAPSVVSEFAPLAAEHPETLIRGADGQPLVHSERWYWPPHGRCYLVDPWTPGGEAFLRNFAELMHEYGITYLKADFISNWTGARTLRHGMGILREALGPEIILRPCSTALNTNLGICNEIGIARDIGNAAGNWEHMGVETLELASKWFMHRRFWLNNPDSLIVGDPSESVGEAIGRVTMHALTGGVMFLADRMPELEAQPERLRLVPLILPSSDQPARPIDLFRLGVAGRSYPRLWHLHADAGWGEWEVLGILNWSAEPLTETVRFADLGLAPGAEYLVWDFWRGELAGRFTGDFEVTVPAGSARCLRIMRVPERPAVLATGMHVTQGLVDLRDVRWDEEAATLSGVAIRAPEESGTLAVYLPPGWAPAEGAGAELIAPCVARLRIDFVAAEEPWSLRCMRVEGGAAPALDPPDSILNDATVPELP